MPLINNDRRGAARIRVILERRDLPDIDFAIDFVLDPPLMPERPARVTNWMDGTQIMHDRERYLAQIAENFVRLNLALKDRLADLAGWHGEKRREDAARATPGYGDQVGTNGEPSTDPDWPRSS